jgi:hypothetical protein
MSQLLLISNTLMKTAVLVDAGNERANTNRETEISRYSQKISENIAKIQK